MNIHFKLKLPPRLAESGIFWMLLSSFMFSWMGVFVKLGASYFNTAELVFYRGFINWILIAIIILPQQDKTILTRHWRLHLNRSIAGFLSLMMNFYALVHLPLATSITLNYTSPLFLGLLTVFWLKEKLSTRMIVTLLSSFFGVLLMMRPEFSPQQWIASIIGLGSGFMAAIAYMNLKQLAVTGEPDWRTVFYFSMVCTIGSACLMIFEKFTPLSLANVWVLLGMGVSATLGQVTMTRAYRVGKTMVVASFAYSSIIFAAFFGWMIWDEMLTWVGVVGMLLIIGNGILNAMVRRG